MVTKIRTLIDFATGENWEMPLHLWEQYERNCVQLKLKVPPGLTCIEYWLTTLSNEDRNLVTKKK